MAAFLSGLRNESKHERWRHRSLTGEEQSWRFESRFGGMLIVLQSPDLFYRREFRGVEWLSLNSGLCLIGVWSSDELEQEFDVAPSLAKLMFESRAACQSCQKSLGVLLMTGV
jgi:hypothetical protein